MTAWTVAGLLAILFAPAFFGILFSSFHDGRNGLKLLQDAQAIRKGAEFEIRQVSGIAAPFGALAVIGAFYLIPFLT